MTLKDLNIDTTWTLFLDRDGVINKKLENDYVKHSTEFEFIDGVIPALASLNKVFGTIVVVTNQQCIGKGIITAEDLELVHKNMLYEISYLKGRIDKIYFSPYLASENHPTRKPAIGMALQAQQDFPHIDLKKSIIVGDSNGENHVLRRARRRHRRAERRVIALRRHRRYQVRARGLDRCSRRADVIGRLRAARLVDGAVAVVVLEVAADLAVRAADRGVEIVAVTHADAVVVRVAVAVHIAWMVLASFRALDAAIDGARIVVLARDHRAGRASEAEHAFLASVAVERVGALRVVGRVPAALHCLIAAVERARDRVVALRVLRTGPTKGLVDGLRALVGRVSDGSGVERPREELLRCVRPTAGVGHRQHRDGKGGDGETRGSRGRARGAPHVSAQRLRERHLVPLGAFGLVRAFGLGDRDTNRGAALGATELDHVLFHLARHAHQRSTSL